ncbi:arylamine N-acetyltransferase 1 [Crucibulum laeve]|uniref:Arylamine N-acetyltransferase 1 n=1 Tax=Crucibulum laeve TaxID=68775 RepID=A0A5C3LKE4_9AGAR|nr:arylamine N-acetyltransferase 1 [Crucibulum laeve]
MISSDEHRDGILRGGAWIKNVPSYYSPAQVLQWLSAINFVPQVTEEDITTRSFPAPLETLEQLIRLHLLTFPFENTAMHYTVDHEIDVTPEGAFKRLVAERKGSYCFGQNTVLLGMLRGLGYRAYAASARVNEGSLPPNYTSLVHMVVLVQPLERSNRTYLVDVGFGSPGLARPILLSNSEKDVVTGITPTEKHKLTRNAIPLSTSTVPAELKWNLEVWHEKKDDPHASWRILYSFSEEEFFPADAQDASFVVSQNYASNNIFCNDVICVKHFPLDEEDAKRFEGQAGSETCMYRMVLIGKEVKKYVGSSSEVVQIFLNEVERIRALRETFGIDIDDEAERHIRGRKSAIVKNGEA